MMIRLIFLILLMIASLPALPADENPWQSKADISVSSKQPSKWYDIDWEKFKNWRPIKHWFFPMEPKPQAEENPSLIPSEHWIKTELYDPCQEGTIACDKNNEDGQQP